MPATSAIELARTRLLSTLAGLQSTLPPWRFHRYPPTEVVSPCVWIDYPTITHESPWVVASFPIVIGLDGADHAQAAAFDFAVAHIWDALNSTEDCTVSLAAPWARDIGGPSSRLYVITVAVDISADTLCLNPLYTESATA
jgi:hypothetical protein